MNNLVLCGSRFKISFNYLQKYTLLIVYEILLLITKLAVYLPISDIICKIPPKRGVKQRNRRRLEARNYKIYSEEMLALAVD